MEEAKFLHHTKITHRATIRGGLFFSYGVTLFESVTLEPRVVEIVLVVAQRSVVG